MGSKSSKDSELPVAWLYCRRDGMFSVSDMTDKEKGGGDMNE